jgi:hypothetical protein
LRAGLLLRYHSGNLYGTSNAAAFKQQQLEILYEGERHCISAVAFMVAGADLNRRPLGYAI